MIIKASHKPIKTYYQELAGYAAQDATHELAVRSAFQNLLAESARRTGWTLIPEQSYGVNGKTVYPDGTLRDQWQFPRGYWEAKDTHDDLDAEIRKKRAAGYPFNNIIFEDTRQGVLFQGGNEVLRADLTDRDQLADLLNLFLTYSEPNIAQFERAIDEFQDHIPQLAKGLNERIKQAHQDNREFEATFNTFFALCQEALNPNLSRDAVDEMLIQHLLTERLLRTVFDMSEFTQRNIIAAEVEKVITALTSQSFSRREFLGQLDRFYVAIESAARELTEFSEKQHFLNTIYEQFFQGYSVKVADTHGIVYTPQEIVDFMCAAVEEVLHTEFGLKLGDAGVNILDPCTGTGNFIVNLLRRIPPRNLERAYKEQLFANEVLLLPYYIATLNIEHAYRDLARRYEPFAGLCFVDTLDLAEGRQLPMFVEKNTARVQREKQAPITVIIGNPPYNVGQLNENDNNKNRAYGVIDERVRETYAQDSAATNKNALSDAYVKFFRWATDRLGDRDGVVCFVSNNSFIDQIAFDGMRKHLLQDFTRIYHIDLHGNVRQNPKLSGTTHNVFGIQVGVGITVAVRSAQHENSRLFYHRVPEFWRKEQKLRWLASCGTPSPGPFPASREGDPLPTSPASRGGATPPLTPPRKQGGEKDAAPQTGREEVAERNAGWTTTAKDWPVMRDAARELRNEQTPAEKRLWARLRKQQVAGFKFRRQQSIGRYIVDFYCSDARLIIEVDGSIHDEMQEQDQDRQDVLEHLGYRVLRFTNEDVVTALDGVIETIAEALADPLPASPASRGGVENAHEVDTNPLPASPASRGGENLAHAEWESTSDQDEFAGRGRENHTADSPSLLAGRGQGWGDSPSLLAGRGQGVGSNVMEWQELTPDTRHTWLRATHADQFESFMPMGDKDTKAGRWQDAETIFKTYGRGVATSRDVYVYDFDRAKLIPRVKRFVEDYNAEVDRWRRAGGPDNVDDFVNYERIKWSRDLKLDLQRHNYAEYDDQNVRQSLYRPFTKRYLFFDRVLNEEVYQFPQIFPTPESEGENRVIVISDIGYRATNTSALMTDHIPELHLCASTDSHQCFPFYVYDDPLPTSPASRGGESDQPAFANRRGEDDQPAFASSESETSATDSPSLPAGRGQGWGDSPSLPAGRGQGWGDSPSLPAGRGPGGGVPHARENITDWALAQFRDHYGNEAISKWDIFYYVYGVLHHPTYRERYGDNLKRDLPRLPFAPDFRAFAEAGRQLAELHLNYETVQPYELEWITNDDAPMSFRVKKMRLRKPKKAGDPLTVQVNDYLTLAGIPAAVQEYRLGNRSALDWVIDQYQVKTDKRSGIVSDPNDATHERSIVDLIERVVRVSVETVQIVKALAEQALLGAES
ncbi:MAG: DUF559 domain-containing protein [Anaerolineae bacterium]|nr:DUF559 domain-containing protein [Anaerolineae bacterium]